MFDLALKQDRIWKITINAREFILSEYNDEITGYDDELHNLAPDIIHYGGNAYYVTGTFANQRGWIVEEMPRQCE